jgi:hypothetical protein
MEIDIMNKTIKALVFVMSGVVGSCVAHEGCDVDNTAKLEEQDSVTLASRKAVKAEEVVVAENDNAAADLDTTAKDA